MTPPPARSRVALAALVSLGLLGLAGCADDAPGEPAPSASSDPSRSSDPSVASAPRTSATPAAVPAAFRELESRFDARLGVYAVDTGSGAEVAWREDERFAFASTVKALAAGALLDEVGVRGLDREVPITADAIIPHSPVVEPRVGDTMTLRELAAAAMTESDNAAGNYLFEALGGPPALDAALAALGDETTTVSRDEPELNEGTPGDERDTTTPRAIAGDLREYVLGDTLSDPEEALLTEWLTSTRTGDTLVRADLPSGWRVGDKSGSGGYGSRNDIAVVWPRDRAPIVIAVLSSRDGQDAEYDDRLVAQAAAAAVSALG